MFWKNSFTHTSNRSWKNKTFWLNKKAKTFLSLSAVFIILTGVVLGHFVPAWAAQPVIVNPLPDQSAIENVAFNFSFGVNAFQNIDGAPITYTAQLSGGSPLPGWLSFDSATRTFSGTPSNGDVGNFTVEVIASDGGLSVSDFFDITVYDEASAPFTTIVANPIPNQNATEDAAFSFQFAANTFESTESTLTYFAQLSGGSALPVWLNFDAATRTFSGTPVNGDVGIISVDLIADDGNGGTATDTFDIIIANVNDAPTIANAIPNQNATEDSTFNFQFAANTFNDVDAGTTLTYSAQLAGGGMLPAWLQFDAATRTFSGTPLNAHVGTVSIDVIASDGNGGDVTDTFNIVIANTNDVPTIANPIPNQNGTEDAAFYFQFAANTFNDPDLEDSLTYTAQWAGGGALPTWLSFDPVTRTFSGTPSNGDVGTLTIDVIADDGNGGTVTDTFNIVVANTNDVPTIANAIPNQNATEDVAFSFQFAANTFNDIDVGDTLTYTAQLAGGSALPAWLSFDAATRTFSGTPASGDVGTISIDLIADDGNGGTVTDTFNIETVATADNVGPTASIVVSDTSLVTGETATITITFSEAVIGLDVSDFVVGNGSLSSPSSSDGGITWTATLTPTTGATNSINVIVLDNTGVVDLSGNVGTGTTSSNNYAVDTAVPIISNIVATSADDGESATITWATDEVASSQIAIGLTSGLVNGIYAEQNTGPRVTSHTYQIPNLKMCTRYYYQVLSKDAFSQQAVSEIRGFTTNGCPGTVMAHMEEAITTASGGSLSLGDITITIPSGFAATDATFQIKRIDASEARAVIGKPGTLVVLGGYMYHIEALTDASTTVDNFLQPIAITFNYPSTNLTGIDPETLMIYHYDDANNWNELDSCTTDIAAKTITCETSSFSTFALVANAIINNLVVSGGLAVQPGGATDLADTGQSMSLHAVVAGLLFGGGSALIIIRRKIIVKN